MPRVTIGVPVRNGEKFLRGLLDSLLSQTYSDFELLISDNASSDATEEICREYTKSDERIVYHKQRVNIGLAENYNYLVRSAQAGFF